MKSYLTSQSNCPHAHLMSDDCNCPKLHMEPVTWLLLAFSSVSTLRIRLKMFNQMPVMSMLLLLLAHISIIAVYAVEFGLDPDSFHIVIVANISCRQILGFLMSVAGITYFRFFFIRQLTDEGYHCPSTSGARFTKYIKIYVTFLWQMSNLLNVLRLSHQKFEMKIVKSYDQLLAQKILLHLKLLSRVNLTTNLRQSYDKS